uniref:Uncharacterized protein n=1 Tax=Rhizophora mucronata TaxID=61149 RepID=A0A2P2J301_RHIMU
MEFLDKQGQLRVERSQQRKYPLKELDRHEVVINRDAFKIIDPSSEKGVETIDRVCRGWIHGRERDC